jgi:hypothetical protein
MPKKESEPMNNIISIDNLEAMKNVDIATSNKENLVDIRDVKINTNLPKKERIKQFLNQIQNPYLFKCGNLTVQVEYADNGISLEDKLIEYVRAI